MVNSFWSTMCGLLCSLKLQPKTPELAQRILMLASNQPLSREELAACREFTAKALNTALTMLVEAQRRGIKQQDDASEELAAVLSSVAGCGHEANVFWRAIAFRHGPNCGVISSAKQRLRCEILEKSSGELDAGFSFEARRDALVELISELHEGIGLKARQNLSERPTAPS